MNRLLRAHRGQSPAEDGFTLIELLVVLVILPLIIGAIAEALITSFSTESSNSSRLSDTLNAQLAQQYFVRDVQGASLITTVDNSGSGLFSGSSPEVCAPGSTTLHPAPTLLVALYHPATLSGTSPVDISYWVEPTGVASEPVEVDRYACTLTNAGTYTTPASKVVIASGPPGTALSQGIETLAATAQIQPPQFSAAAQIGWTSVAAWTTASSVGTLSTLSTLQVGTPIGFTLGTTTTGGVCAPSTSLASATGCTPGNNTLTVGTTQGPEQVTCTGFDTTTTPATFTGCTGGGSGFVTGGSVITQTNISAVQLSVTAPASSYHFSLLGAPRPVQSTIMPALAPGTSPNLLTLGSAGINPGNGGGGVACPDGATANICIGTANGPGSIVVDSSGTILCNGAGVHTYIHFQLPHGGTVQTVAQSTSSDCNTVQAVQNLLGAPDPLQGQLPQGGLCMPASFVNNLPINPAPVNGNAVPGVYTTQLSGTLEPGVYVVEGGLGTVTPATYSSSDEYFYPYDKAPYYSKSSGTQDPHAGALLFIPARNVGQYNPEQGCYTDVSAPAQVTVDVQGILPLDHTQASAYFSPYTAVGDFHLWLWQDASNTTSLLLPHPGQSYSGGNEEEMLYAPDATLEFTGNGQLATGTAVVGGIKWNGNDTLCLNWPSYSSPC